MHDLTAIGKMTLCEYHLRMEAYQLSELNRREQIAMQAWFNQTVQATTGGKHPKPKYKRFKQFFDRKQQELQIRNAFGDDAYGKAEADLHKTQAQIFAERVKKFQELKKAGRIDMQAWRQYRK